MDVKLINHRKAVCRLYDRSLEKRCVFQGILLQYKKRMDYLRNVLKGTVANRLLLFLFVIIIILLIKIVFLYA